MSSNVLMVNASYEPMKLIPMEDAVRLIYTDKAEVVEEDTVNVMRSPTTTMARPLVIRLKKFIRVPQKFRRKVTNTFLFARDQYTCQYCGRHQSQLGTRNGRKEVLNRDHIQPQSRGGENTWENCVTSCSTCNSRKDNKTPQEAGMKLLTENPMEPHLVHLRWTVRSLTEMQKKYIVLFYGEEIAKELWK